MARISYVNGAYVHHSHAAVHIEDRGYQFSDGVYEVMAFYSRILLDEALHLARLSRSLKELAIPEPMDMKTLRFVMRELMDRNDREHGTLYLQISRGVAKRDHVFGKNLQPSLVMTVTGPKMPKEKEVKEGIKVITLSDQRWARRDIKSISLLPNILAKNKAAVAGAKEAWLYDEKGFIFEGSSSNSVIITTKNELVTAPADEHILGGVTRKVVLELARRADIQIIERPFTVKEAKAAKEAFMMSTTLNLLPVVVIDGAKIADGKPGALTQKLLSLYHAHITRQTGKQWN